MAKKKSKQKKEASATSSRGAAAGASTIAPKDQKIAPQAMPAEMSDESFSGSESDGSAIDEIDINGRVFLVDSRDNVYKYGLNEPVFCGRLDDEGMYDSQGEYIPSEAEERTFDPETLNRVQHPTLQLIEDQAKDLQLESALEEELFWGAQAALKAPLPDNVEEISTKSGQLVYFDTENNTPLKYHPIHERYEDYFEQLKNTGPELRRRVQRPVELVEVAEGEDPEEKIREYEEKQAALREAQQAQAELEAAKGGGGVGGEEGGIDPDWVLLWLMGIILLLLFALFGYMYYNDIHF